MGASTRAMIGQAQSPQLPLASLISKNTLLGYRLVGYFLPVVSFYNLPRSFQHAVASFFRNQS